jgi:hypothetical protein
VFTVPATTNNLVSMSGAGADGRAPSSGVTGSRAVSGFVVSGDNNGTVAGTYDEMRNAQIALGASINGGGVVYYTQRNLRPGPNGLSVVFTANLQTGNVVAGSAVVDQAFWYLTGPITNTTPSGFGYYIDFNETFSDPGSVGAATTGFDRVFPGGSFGPSSITTFSNVAVVPNQTYVIQNNKSLTITYFS